MAYRNKTYVCFDADNDIYYYRLMEAWKQNDNSSFSFFNAHEINNIWGSSSEETIKRLIFHQIMRFMDRKKLKISNVNNEVSFIKEKVGG